MDHMDTLPNSALRMGSETSCLQIFQVTEDTSEEDEDAQIEVRTPRLEKSWRKVGEKFKNGTSPTHGLTRLTTRNQDVL